MEHIVTEYKMLFGVQLFNMGQEQVYLKELLKEQEKLQRQLQMQNS